METRQPITESLRSLIRTQGIPQSGKVCSLVPGSDVKVCVEVDQVTQDSSIEPHVRTSVEDKNGVTLSQQRFDLKRREKIAQIESHLQTLAEEQRKGYASGLMQTTNEVIKQMIHDFPDFFRGANVQGVIRDEATDAYRRSVDTLGQRTSWSSRQAQKLRYTFFDDERGPVWVKSYATESLPQTIVKRILGFIPTKKAA